MQKQNHPEKDNQPWQSGASPFSSRDFGIIFGVKAGEATGSVASCQNGSFLLGILLLMPGMLPPPSAVCGQGVPPVWGAQEAPGSCWDGLQNFWGGIFQFLGLLLRVLTHSRCTSLLQTPEEPFVTAFQDLRGLQGSQRGTFL